MKYFYFLALLLSGCGTMTTTAKNENERLEVALHTLRSDLEELKLDLNTLQMEIQVVEGKVLSYDDNMNYIKEESADLVEHCLKSLKHTLAKLEKNLIHFEEKQTHILSDVKSLFTHAENTNKALTQYQTKFNELQESVALHQESLSQISQIRKSLSEMAKLTKSNLYTVRPGDTLEKIAKSNNTSLDSLKKANHLKEDLIIIGQELLIPAYD